MPANKVAEFGNVPGRPGYGVTQTPPNRGVRQTQITPMASRRGVNQPKDRHETQTLRRPYLLESDILLVTSEDDVTHRFGWDHKTYFLRPGDENKPIPFPALVNALGDPRSAKGEVIVYRSETGEKGVVPHRYDQFVSLFAHYGIVDESIDQVVYMAPRVRVTTLTGDPVVFPAQNPDMAPWPVPKEPEHGREQPIGHTELVEQVRAENEQMRADLTRMQAMLDQRLGGQARDETDVHLADALGGALPDEGPRTAV